ncbi:MAG: methionine--tRNA ligase [Candidatus Poseidoniaceae archaeon]|nr:methionine--tRNA ligase [Candidatus Poseidoniaceae archaeon]MBL6889065.1 methionine--tRNA ligase [Candidatus Poseidoniaceae archaeon]
MSDGDHVLICVAWPYANGPLHLGHVAGCYLPPDIHARFERALGNRVLMVSGSDEHGTPITVSAEQEGIEPQDVVDRFHEINSKALLDLGCTWMPNIDERGVEYGGSLFNRTTDIEHKQRVQSNFKDLYDAGFFEMRTMEQYYELNPSGGGRFLPDRYIEGTCPICEADGARGDQCDSCGATYESSELRNPISKMNPTFDVEIRDTEHLFYRLDLFQEALQLHADQRQSVWKPNVRAMTKQWLDMGLRPRAVTRDLTWGINVPIDGDDWIGKCIYVWFEAVQGYLTCSQIWSEKYGEDSSAWEAWWTNKEQSNPRHYYFLGKDNVPFHTVIWPAILMGLNHVRNGKTANDPIELPTIGDLHLEDNVPAMEYLMLAGGQFSKSRKHAIWLPSFLERFDPDTLRYYLSINMPEGHDTDFTWKEFVDRINNELIATYGNFVNRVMSLTARLPNEGISPLLEFDDNVLHAEDIAFLDTLHSKITDSLKRHRYKEALRFAMNAAQHGNQMLQNAAPWKHLKSEEGTDGRHESLSSLAFGWRLCRYLAVVTQPFLPFSSQKLWAMLGLEGDAHLQSWNSALDWTVDISLTDENYQPLFKRLDLDEIVQQEQSLVEESKSSTIGHGVKGGKKEKKNMKEEQPEGIAYLEFETFMEVELRVGKIVNVEEHPNADRLYVVKLDDGTDFQRTICAGIKEYYSSEELIGKTVVFVANLKPRPLRGVVSEGMMLAADDGDGAVKLVTIDGDISTGSLVR